MYFMHKKHPLLVSKVATQSLKQRLHSNKLKSTKSWNKLTAIKYESLNFFKYLALMFEIKARENWLENNATICS